MATETNPPPLGGGPIREITFSDTPNFKGTVSRIESLEHIGLETEIEIKEVEFLTTPTALSEESKNKFLQSMTKSEGIYWFFSKELISGNYTLLINNEYEVKFEIE